MPGTSGCARQKTNSREPPERCRIRVLACTAGILAGSGEGVDVGPAHRHSLKCNHVIENIADKDYSNLVGRFQCARRQVLEPNCPRNWLGRRGRYNEPSTAKSPVLAYPTTSSGVLGKGSQTTSDIIKMIPQQGEKFSTGKRPFSFVYLTPVRIGVMSKSQIGALTGLDLLRFPSRQVNSALQIAERF